jgi:hypothetical protein
MTKIFRDLKFAGVAFGCLALGISLSFFSHPAFPQSGQATRLPAKKSKSGKPVEPVDWIQRAEEELTNSGRSAKAPAGAHATSDAVGELPTPATVVVVAAPHNSMIEKSALRIGFAFEPYQPRGLGTFGVDETLQYDSLPASMMGNVDLRWLPFEVGPTDFEMGEGSGRLLFGGYLGFGYSRQAVPLVTQTGFRYEDVALNSMRVETGAALGYSLSSRWNLEGRLGLGRQMLVQTSRFAEVVGNFDRSFVVGAMDVQYYVLPKLALMASVAHRSPVSGGTGSIGFDPLTVSGGILVQVR